MDHYVFVKRYVRGNFFIFLLYDDDMLIVGYGIEKITSIKNTLSKSIAMKDLEQPNWYLAWRYLVTRKAKD